MPSACAQGQVVVQIHCGSRGLGHQVATDYIEQFQQASKRYGYELPDRQLVCAPLDSPEGQKLPGGDELRGQLRLGQPPGADLSRARGVRGGAWAARCELGPVPDLRRGAQHGQGRDAHRRRHARPGCASTGRAPRAPSVPAIRTCPPITGPSASRCWCPAAWARHPTSWSARPRAWRTRSAPAVTAPGGSMSRAEAKRQVRGEKLRGELEQGGIVIRAGSLARPGRGSAPGLQGRGPGGGRGRAAGIAGSSPGEPLAVIKG